MCCNEVINLGCLPTCRCLVLPSEYLVLEEAEYTFTYSYDGNVWHSVYVNDLQIGSVLSFVGYIIPFRTVWLRIYKNGEIMTFGDDNIECLKFYSVVEGTPKEVKGCSPPPVCIAGDLMIDKSDFVVPFGDLLDDEFTVSYDGHSNCTEDITFEVDYEASNIYAGSMFIVLTDRTATTATFRVLITDVIPTDTYSILILMTDCCLGLPILVKVTVTVTP